MRFIEPSSDAPDRELNWAGNYAYEGRVVRPDSVEALQELISSSERVGFLGTRHSFNAIADSDLLIDMRALPEVMDVNLERGSVVLSGNVTYGALAPYLQAKGAALENLASLPHISVAGSISTGTHGSGVDHGGLATAVRALDIVCGDGELVTVERGNPDFAGCVGIGAKRDRDAILEREFQDRGAGINFFAILPQPGGVKFDGAAGFFCRCQKFFVKRRTVLHGADAKFFRQVNVADNVKQL